MSNKSKYLFIFEGRRSEFKIVQKLEENFLGENFSIKCVFDAEIYQSYSKMKQSGKH